MGGDRARDKDWLRAREHHLRLTDTIFQLLQIYVKVLSVIWV